MKTLTDKLQYLYGHVNSAHREYVAEAIVEIRKLADCKIWLQWCINSDDSAEYFGTDATEKINALLSSIADEGIK